MAKTYWAIRSPTVGHRRAWDIQHLTEKAEPPLFIKWNYKNQLIVNPSPQSHGLLRPQVCHRRHIALTHKAVRVTKFYTRRISAALPLVCLHLRGREIGSEVASHHFQISRKINSLVHCQKPIQRSLHRPLATSRRDRFGKLIFRHQAFSKNVYTSPIHLSGEQNLSNACPSLQSPGLLRPQICPRRRITLTNKAARVTNFIQGASV